MMKEFKRGFTLIELLVVIAIIGILAAIVLASLGTARNKGNDAKVKEQLGSVRNAAEVFYSTNNHYGQGSAAGQDCDANAAGSMAADGSSGMTALMTASNWPGSVAVTCQTNAVVSPATTATAYAAAHILSDGTYWCVDSTGASKSEAANLGAGVTACP